MEHNYSGPYGKKKAQATGLESQVHASLQLLSSQYPQEAQEDLAAAHGWGRQMQFGLGEKLGSVFPHSPIKSLLY